MSNRHPLPDRDDPQFWPKLVAAETAEARDAIADGRSADLTAWQTMRASAVKTWADHVSDPTSWRGRLGH